MEGSFVAPGVGGAVTDWMVSPTAATGISFLSGDGWERWSYVRLAERARRTATLVRAEGAEPGGVVVLVLESGADLVAALFGVMWAGCTPTVVAQPSFGRSMTSYEEHVARIVEISGARLVLADADVAPVLDAVRDRTRARVVVPDPDAYEPLDQHAAPAPLAVLQFTSGSTGTPRGVRLRSEQLAANVAMIRSWLRMEPHHGTASWLPLFHDMGLVGCCFTPVVNRSDLWLMRPDQFLQRPLEWLQCFDRPGVRISAMPTFGLAYVSRWLGRSTVDRLEGLDLSGWDTLILGAERVDAAAMREFAELLAPAGFDRRALLPAYGLAEATLATSGVAVHEVPRAVSVDLRGSALGDPVRITAEADYDDPCIGDGSGWLVGCGRPLPPGVVTVEGPDGRGLPEDHLGELVVESPAVGDGYEGDGAGATVIKGRRLRTGDAGFVHGGQVHVVGRLADGLKVRGRAVFVEDLEAQVAAIPGPSTVQYVVVPEADPDVDGVVLVVERASPEWLEEAAAAVASALPGRTPVRTLVAGRGAISRTTSGKPRRRAIWEQLVRGDLGAVYKPEADPSSLG